VFVARDFRCACPTLQSPQITDSANVFLLPPPGGGGTSCSRDFHIPTDLRRRLQVFRQVVQVYIDMRTQSPVPAHLKSRAAPEIGAPKVPWKTSLSTGTCGKPPKVPPLHGHSLEMYNLSARTTSMPNGAINGISLRVRPEQKAALLRAATLKHMDLTEFVLQHALNAAKEVIEPAERVQLSEQDRFRVLELLKNPPAPSARLLAAARALPEDA